MAEAPPGSIRDGIGDIRAGLKRWPVWWTLTWHTIRSQYRRTYFGPWWMTLQMVIFVAGLSLLFGFLLNQDLQTFVPYVTLGFVGFTWMTGMIQRGANSIIGNGAAIKTTPGPLSIYALKGFASQTIQFGHDAVVVVLVLIVFQVHLSAAIVLCPLLWSSSPSTVWPSACGSDRSSPATATSARSSTRSSGSSSSSHRSSG